MNTDAKPLQNVFVVGALAYTLEPSPTAQVMDENGGEVGPPGVDFSHGLVETVRAGDIQPNTAMLWAAASGG